MIVKMINNFLIINCIGNNDKLGLRVNKDFFIYILKKKKNNNEKIVSEILDFLGKHHIKLDKTFTIIVNLGPGSFSGIRVSLAVAKGIAISKNTPLYAFKDSDLKVFDQENIEKLLKNNLIEKKLIRPLYSTN